MDLTRLVRGAISKDTGKKWILGIRTTVLLKMTFFSEYKASEKRVRHPAAGSGETLVCSRGFFVHGKSLTCHECRLNVVAEGIKRLFFTFVYEMIRVCGASVKMRDGKRKHENFQNTIVLIRIYQVWYKKKKKNAFKSTNFFFLNLQ